MMSKQLHVHLYESLIGQLEQDKHGRISFTYDSSWLNSDGSVALSHSLPLRKESFKGKECQGFFAGVLPEEENRRIISTILGVSPHNDFALLEQIGGECAGAVTFLPKGQKLPPRAPSYQKLNDSELAEILRELPKRPLMAGRKEVRLSLAGAQNKLAVHIDNHGQISLPLGNSPSTHILKPAIIHFEGMVQNEAFCMRLAKKSGIPTANVSSGSCEDIEFLLAERYDRRSNSDGDLERLHQEDFCQALGLPPHLKYQNEGGPSVEDCFGLIRNVSSTPAPDLLNFLDAVLLNFLIGNNDAHGKNFSFLYDRKNQKHTARLAPLYDLISTRHYPDLSPRMAMKVGKKYLPKEVMSKHWLILWEKAGFQQSAARKHSLQFTRKIRTILSTLTAENAIQQQIIEATDLQAKRFELTAG
ncbi:UNVERIFIED_CONTAM: hypothetical protein GTU68_056223 [Idotea baltica]|nr:hypothetical protein [Idotea baltica]